MGPPEIQPTSHPPTCVGCGRWFVRVIWAFRGNLQIKFISLSDSPRSTTTNPVQGWGWRCCMREPFPNEFANLQALTTGWMAGQTVGQTDSSCPDEMDGWMVWQRGMMSTHRLTNNNNNNGIFSVINPCPVWPAYPVPHLWIYLIRWDATAGRNSCAGARATNNIAVVCWALGRSTAQNEVLI